MGLWQVDLILLAAFIVQCVAGQSLLTTLTSYKSQCLTPWQPILSKSILSLLPSIISFSHIFRQCQKFKTTPGLAISCTDFAPFSVSFEHQYTYSKVDLSKEGLLSAMPCHALSTALPLQVAPGGQSDLLSRADIDQGGALSLSEFVILRNLLGLADTNAISLFELLWLGGWNRWRKIILANAQWPAIAIHQSLFDCQVHHYSCKSSYYPKKEDGETTSLAMVWKENFVVFLYRWILCPFWWLHSAELAGSLRNYTGAELDAAPLQTLLGVTETQISFVKSVWSETGGARWDKYILKSSLFPRKVMNWKTGCLLRISFYFFWWVGFKTHDRTHTPWSHCKPMQSCQCTIFQYLSGTSSAAQGGGGSFKIGKL